MASTYLRIGLYFTTLIMVMIAAATGQLEQATAVQIIGTALAGVTATIATLTTPVKPGGASITRAAMTGDTEPVDTSAISDLRDELDELQKRQKQWDDGDATDNT